MTHLVEQWRQGAWLLLKGFDDEAAAIAFYRQVRSDFPDWRIRRIAVHETTA